VQVIHLFFILNTAFSLLFSPLLRAKAFNYIYIAASEGNASGGHTALRFDNEIYHFQYNDGGIIRLVKDSSTDFDFQYRFLENRSFHQATLDLNERDYDQLHNHFNLRFLQQQQQDAIRREINLNIEIFSNQAQHPQLNIQGAGLFADNNAPLAAESLTIYSLQEQIKLKYGAAFLTNSTEQLKAEIKTLRPEPWPKNSLQFSEGAFSAIPYSFASRYLDSVSKILLLQAIQNGSSLNQQFFFSPEQSLFKLSQSEITHLKSLQQLLTHNLLTLLGSQRPGWGSAAFTLYARILSLAIAIDSRKLVFLDTFRESSPSISDVEVERYKTKFLSQKKQALSLIAQLKAELFTQTNALSEKAYGELEMQSNYYYERERGLQNKQGFRISGQQLLASKSIPLPTELYPRLTERLRETSLARFGAYQINIDQQMRSLYSYDLFTRNCVTEIIRTISQIPTNNKQITELSQLTSEDLIAFIPFGSFHSLSDAYSKQTLPSFRHQQLQEMYREENNALVFFREFNTLSASDYKFNDQDAPFLIFTDDNILLRPIFGSINLLVATTISVYGGLALPFDSGKALKDGTMGVLMSLPELAFFNIRKGSYKHLIPAN